MIHNVLVSRALVSPLSAALLACTLVACSTSDRLEGIREELAKGRLEESLDPLRELLKERPGDAEVLFVYGRTLSAVQQAGLAEWSLREAMKDPDWLVPAGLQLATNHVVGFNFPAAIETATKVLEVEPDSVPALLIRASAYTRSRMHHEEALADCARVLEIDPENISVTEPKILALLALNRVDEVSREMDKLGRRVDEGALGEGATAWHCATTAIFAYESGQVELADRRWTRCLEAHPADPEVVNKAIPFYDGLDRYDRSFEILRRAHEVAPIARGYRVDLATRLLAFGQGEEAEQILVEATKHELPQVASAAWFDLSKHYQAVERYEEAADAIGKAVDLVQTMSTPDSALLLDYADALLIAGNYEKALEIADQMTFAPHQEMIRARVAQEQRDYEGALKHFEAGFILWPDNPYARYHAARAAEALGDFDLAIEQYRYSIRTGAGATEARTRVARIHMAEGHPGAAIQLLRIRADDEPLDAEGDLLSLELWALTTRFGEINPLIEKIREKRPWDIGRAIASVARGVHARVGPVPAMRAIRRDDKIDPEDVNYAEAIRALIEYSIESNAGRDKADADLDAALAANPDSAALRETAALRLELTGAPKEEVRKAYNAALEVDAANVRALEALGRLAAREGDPEAALSYFDRAAAADPSEAHAQVEAARALVALGRSVEAEERLNKLMDEFQFDAPAAQLLAELRLARQDSSERTLDLANRAVRFGGGVPALKLLSRVHEARGETEAAQQAAQQAAQRAEEPAKSPTQPESG